MTAKKPMLMMPLMLVTATVALSAIAAIREPDGLFAFLAAMILLPLAWTVIELRNRGRDHDERWRDDMGSIRWSISAAAVMMIIPLGMTLAISYELTENLGDNLEQRVMGVIFGIIFLFYGNASSKRPVSLTSTKTEPARMQAHTRFAGRVFVITALAYTLIWTFAPIDYALPAAMIILFSGVALAVLNMLRLRGK